ncbi:hypothetical protein A167_01150 [Alcanivorax sp. S71-1-4]|uniref:hypothetical protein n=1 Tax=Alcanivorax sp. S71-1-4 TaxID=1177159 RepID=UPI001357DD09|nr:hypothetical protein [Alcanivorax sp. S71-1-4]KAF0810119.1 hypothetical protein A167_01150 [Alcanivorax sp. S71-1-4]
MNIPTTSAPTGLLRVAIAGLLAITALTGCGGDSSSARPGFISPEGMTAVIATASPDFGSGEVELVDLDTDNMTASGGYHATVSDIAVSSHGQHYYLIERYMTDRVAKIDITNPAVFEWQYSAVSPSDTGSSNPYELIFVNEEKAYLIRYDATTAWIVNPSATTEAEFLLGELDLSAYAAGGAATPRMSAGAIVGDQLFIAMQRLDSSWNPTQDGYVAVFDINTDEEIDTGMGEDGLKGIPLISRNPLGITYRPNLGLLVHGVGNYYTWGQIGGIDRVDPETFAVTQLLAGDQDTGRINHLAVINDNTAYINIYNAYQNASVFRINPATGEVQSEIEEVANTDIRALTADPLGRLWMGDGTLSAPGLRVFDPADDSEVAFIPTTMLPMDITFVVED